MVAQHGLGRWFATGVFGALLLVSGAATQGRGRSAARSAPASRGFQNSGQELAPNRTAANWQNGNNQPRSGQFANGQNGVPPYNQAYRGAYVPPQQTPVARNPNWAYNYNNQPATRPAFNLAPTSAYSRPAVNTLPPAPTIRPLATPPAKPALPQPAPTANRPLTPRETAAALLLAQARTATWEIYEHFDQNAGYSETYREMHKFLQTVKSISTETTLQAEQSVVSTQLADALREAEVSLQVLQIQTDGWRRDADAPAQSEQSPLALQFERMAGTLAELMTASNVAPQDFAAVDDAADTPIRARQ